MLQRVSFPSEYHRPNHVFTAYDFHFTHIYYPEYRLVISIHDNEVSLHIRCVCVHVCDQ
jgi:hypothetical protein